MTNDKSTDPLVLLAQGAGISEERKPLSGDSIVSGDDQSESIMELLEKSLAVQRELLDLWKQRTNDKSADPLVLLAQGAGISEERKPLSGDSIVSGDEQSGSIMELLKEGFDTQRELLDLWKQRTDDKSTGPLDPLSQGGVTSQEIKPVSGDSIVSGDDKSGSIMELLKESLAVQRELLGLWKKTQVEIESLRREIRHQTAGSSERPDRIGVSSIAEELADETVSKLRAVGLRG